MPAKSSYTPGTTLLIDRLRMARRLLEWYEQTTPEEEKDSGLASDTRHWLAHLSVDVPEFNDSDLGYAGIEGDQTSSQTPPEQGHTGTTALSLGHEQYHGMIQRKALEDVRASVLNTDTDNNPHTERDSFGQLIHYTDC